MDSQGAHRRYELVRLGPERIVVVHLQHRLDPISARFDRKAIQVTQVSLGQDKLFIAEAERLTGANRDWGPQP